MQVFVKPLAVKGAEMAHAMFSAFGWDFSGGEGHLGTE